MRKAYFTMVTWREGRLLEVDCFGTGVRMAFPTQRLGVRSMLTFLRTWPPVEIQTTPPRGTYFSHLNTTPQVLIIARHLILSKCVYVYIYIHTHIRIFTYRHRQGLARNTYMWFPSSHKSIWLQDYCCFVMRD